MHDEQYYSLKRIAAVDDIAMDALVADESSSLLWFSFRAKVGTNFDLGARFIFGEHVYFPLLIYPFSWTVSRGTCMITILMTSRNFNFFLLPAIMVIH